MKLSKETAWLIAVTLATVGIALFARFQWQSDWLEVVSFVTAVTGIYLLAIEVTWGWPVAMFSSAAYAVFFFKGGLYADMSLNIFYVLILGHGWWSWGTKTSSKEHLPVSRLKAKHYGFVALALIIGLAVYLPIVNLAKGSAPVVDSSLAVASYVSQFLQNRKFLENWAFWIVVNSGYVVLYAVIKPYYLTAVLSVILIVLSIFGHVNWRRSMRQSPSSQ